MRVFADQSPMIAAPAPAGRPVKLAREADFRLGALLIKPSRLEVVAGARRQLLEPRVMQVLVALARMQDEVVSRDELIDACWGGRIVGEDAINRCISRLRRLAETLDGGFAIQTVARVGYRLNPAPPQQPLSGFRSWTSVWSIRSALVVAARLAVSSPHKNKWARRAGRAHS